jgi:hypothetical protein
MYSKKRFWKILCAAALALVVFGLAASGAPATQAASTGPVPSSIAPVICQVTSPSPDTVNVLNAVSAVPNTAQMRADIVWAVGYTQGNQRLNPLARTLVMRDEGNGWKVLTSPNLPGANYLTAVSAYKANDVWAVGYVRNNGIDQPFVMRYNGVQWKYVWNPDPNESLGFGQLTGVVALSDKEAVAVGYKTGPIINSQPLVLYYNGAVWVELTPGAIEPSSRITSVAGTSIKDLWIAATLGDSETGTLSLLYRYDGGKWNLVTKASGTLASLAVTEGRVWAVGNLDVDKAKQTLAVAYDKGKGQVDRIKTFNRDVDHNFLTSVVADGDLVYAVGFTGKPENQVDLYTLVLRFDGQEFIPLESPSPNNLDRLFGATLSNGNLWAVGDSRMWFEATNDLSTTTLILSTMCVPATPPTPTPRPMTFTDVHPSDYFQQAVAYLYGKGVISGYADNTFRPYNFTTRAQLAKMIVLAEEWPIYTQGGPHFVDVPETDTFYGYIETAYSRGIVGGYSDGTFRPVANVTRGQLCKIVVLAEGWSTNTVGGPHFKDVPATNPFYNYIETAYNAVIISGYNDGTFGVGNSATRGQISKVVYQAIMKP